MLKDADLQGVAILMMANEEMGHGEHAFQYALDAAKMPTLAWDISKRHGGLKQYCHTHHQPIRQEDYRALPANPRGFALQKYRRAILPPHQEVKERHSGDGENGS